MKGVCLDQTISQGIGPIPWLTVVSSVLLVVALGLNDIIFPVGAYDRSAILNGEWWRLFTGHALHYSSQHLLWDLLVFAIVGWCIEQQSKRQWILSLLWSFIGVSLVLLMFMPQVEIYCGLSGALNGWLVVAAYQQWQKHRQSMYLVVVGLTTLKIVYEMIIGQPLFSTTVKGMIAEAHLAGLVAGGMYVIFNAMCKFLVKTLQNHQ